MQSGGKKSPGLPPSNTVTPQQPQQDKQSIQQKPSSAQQNASNQQQQPAQAHQAQQQQNNTQAGSGGSNGASIPTAGGEGRRISCEDIQLVQNLIERCLQLYMNQREVITTLLNQAKIEPGFTSLVWQKLEEQNPEFFKAYYIRLKLKRQITLFNLLLEQQVQLMQKMHPVKTSIPSLQNGMHSQQVHHLPIGYPVPQHPPIPTASHPHIVSMPMMSPSPPVLSGGHPMSDSFTASQDSPGSNGVVDMAPEVTLLSTGSSISQINNDLPMGSSGMLPGGSTFPFNAMGNPPDMTGIGMDVPANIPLDATFSASDTHAHITTDTDVSGSRELGLLGHLPRNFSLSDLTAELTNSSDLLGSYTGYPFLSADSDAYICSPDEDFPDDEKMLDHITDPLSYEDFVDEK